MLVFLCTLSLYAQDSRIKVRNELPMLKHLLLLQGEQNTSCNRSVVPQAASSSPVFDTSRWAFLIDSTWGVGANTVTKFTLLQQMWDTLNQTYSGFVHLPNYNWDSLVAAKKAEVNGGVSRGRFAAIMNDLMRYINDGHSQFYDFAVNYPNVTLIHQGFPVFRGESGLFGACLTTAGDSTSMVYYAPLNHPFGLKQGDIILGYNGIPWTELVRTLLKHQLPNSCYKGSTDAATFHRYMQSAGENWYLFDTINIKKCSGEVVNLPTSLMNGHMYQQFCTEQMPVEGVHLMTELEYYYQNRILSSGVISGTMIGYVYMYDCSDGTGDSLYLAIKSLVEDSSVNGLIIDIRTNFGGTFRAFEKAFNYLNSGNTSWIGYGERSDPNNRLAMVNDGDPAWYDFNDNDPSYCPIPVAVLCGPNAVSAGDLFPVLFKHNPYVKTFGMSTGGAFGAFGQLHLIDTVNYAASEQQANFFQVSDPTYYMSHTEFPVDVPVWFNKDSVCNGTDNIVSAAVQWISSQINNVRSENILLPNIEIMPNPSTGRFGIVVSSQISKEVTVRVCNILGAPVWTSRNYVTNGQNRIVCNIAQHSIPDGLYFVYVDGIEKGSLVGRLIIAK